MQTIVSGANLPSGLAFDVAGNLFVTEFAGNDILRVDHITGAVTVFSNDTILADSTVYNSPESIAFGADFTKMYVSDADRFGAGGGIHVVDPTTGAGLGFFALPTSSGADGAGESDWLAFNTASTLYMTNESTAQGVMQVNQTTGDVVQPSFIPTLPTVGYALSFDKKGDLWLGDSSTILEYSATGTLLQTITNPNFSVVFAPVFNPAGDTFFAGDSGNGNIYTYDLTGALLGSFTTATGLQGLAVAPGSGGDAPVTKCTTTLTGVHKKSLVVSSGTLCLVNSTITGTITVKEDAALSVIGSTVGALKSSGANGLTVCHSHLKLIEVLGDSTPEITPGPNSPPEGSSFVLIGDGGDGGGSCGGNTIRDNVTLQDQSGGVELGGNNIAGSVVVKQNVAPGGGSPTEDAATEIENNHIGGSLSCSRNTPAPVNGGVANTVVGGKSGQCATRV